MVKKPPDLRVAPQNLYPISYEAERSVLMALLTDASAVPEILSRVIPDDFMDSDHRIIFRIAGALFEKQISIDLVTVSVEYKKQSNSGKARISDLFKDDITADYPIHIKVLKDLTRRRRLQMAIEEARNKIPSAPDVDVVVAELVTELNQSSSEVVKHPVSMERVVVLSMKRIQAAMESKSIVTGIPSGYRDFDEKIGGFHKGDLIIVADRPGGGKSALLAGLATHSAICGYPSLIVNAEMELVDVGTRMLAGESNIENFDLRRGKVEDHEYPLLVAASGRLSPLPVWIYDDTRWDVIKSQIQALKLVRKDLATVMIDYVTRIRLDRHGDEKRYEQIGRVAKEAKDLAKDLGVAVIMASQLDRSVAKDKREPELSDLRESGDLEQDADMVIFLHRFKPKEEPWRVHCLVKKNRNGPLGFVKLRWIAHRVSFFDWDDDGDGET